MSQRWRPGSGGPIRDSGYYNGVGRLRTTIYCAALTLAAVSADPGHARAQTPATSVFEARWKVTLPEGPAAPAAFDEAHAYVPLRSGKLVALALEDGKSVWTSDVRTIWSPAAGAAQGVAADRTSRVRRGNAVVNSGVRAR